MDIGSLETEDTLHRNLHTTCMTQEEYWRQNSSYLWLNAGDKIMSFFHKQAEGCKHYKAVKEIQSHSQMVQYFDEIKQVAYEQL